jgi:hypothetical protein
VAGLVCVGLALAVIGAVWARWLRLAAEDPWSQLPIGTKLEYWVVVNTGTGPFVSAEPTYVLVGRTSLSATIDDFDRRHPSEVTETRRWLGDAGREAFFEGLPQETITTTAGTFDCVRYEQTTPDSLTTISYTRELPVYVKLVYKRAEFEQVSTLVRVERP